MFVKRWPVGVYEMQGLYWVSLQSHYSSDAYQFEFFVENLCVEQKLVTLHHLSAFYVLQDIENSLKIALQIAHYGVSFGVVLSRLHTTTRARDGAVERSREIAEAVRFVLRVVALSLEAETRGQSKPRRVRRGLQVCNALSREETTL